MRYISQIIIDVLINILFTLRKLYLIIMKIYQLLLSVIANWQQPFFSIRLSIIIDRNSNGEKIYHFKNLQFHRLFSPYFNQSQTNNTALNVLRIRGTIVKACSICLSL